MSYAQVIEVGRELFYVTMMLAVPALAVSLVVGLIVSILQAVTSIQEQTLSFAPRLVAVGVIIIVTLAWSLQLAVQFTVHMLEVALEATR